LGAGAGAGILIGLFLFFFPSVALFVVAIIIGIFLGILVYDVALIYTGWPYAYFVCVGVGAIVLPLIAICIKKVRWIGAFVVALIFFVSAVYHRYDELLRSAVHCLWRQLFPAGAVHSHVH
jgi:ABC-type enterobactin transport system permease subunit